MNAHRPDLEFWTRKKKIAFRLFNEADVKREGRLDAHKFNAIARVLCAGSCEASFSKALLDAAANEDYKLEWEEFWILFKKIFILNRGAVNRSDYSLFDIVVPYLICVAIFASFATVLDCSVVHRDIKSWKWASDIFGADYEFPVLFIFMFVPYAVSLVVLRLLFVLHLK